MALVEGVGSDDDMRRAILQVTHGVVWPDTTTDVVRLISAQGTEGGFRSRTRMMMWPPRSDRDDTARHQALGVRNKVCSMLEESSLQPPPTI